MFKGFVNLHLTVELVSESTDKAKPAGGMSNNPVTVLVNAYVVC